MEERMSLQGHSVVNNQLGLTTQSPQSTKSCKYQVQHPRLVKVLKDLKTPSPVRVVSDSQQPKEGQLRKRAPSAISTDAEEEPFQRPRLKKSLTLNLESSSLLSRRKKRSPSAKSYL